MAKFAFKDSSDYAIRLGRIADAAEEGRIAQKAIYEAAGIVTDRIRANLRSVISGDATGDLEKSLGIAPIEKDREGNWNTKIGFDGYDRNGVPNQLKARVLESGRSNQKKRPFVRPAVRQTKAEAIKAMDRVIQEEIEKMK